MKHPSDEELNGPLDANDRALDDHVMRQLAQAPREAQLARDLWDDIAPRLTAARQRHSGAASPSLAVPRSRARTVTWQLAAGMVIFVAGLLMGTRLGTGGGAPAGAQPVAAASDSVDAAAEVQAAGTRYAAAIARLAGTHDASKFEQGREAAIAALYTASRALAEVSPTDEDALAILHTVSRSHVNRIHEASSRARTIVRF